MSTAENFNDPASGSNDFIDPAVDPAGADDFIDPAAGTTVPDDVTVPTGTTVPGDVTDGRDVTDDVTDDVNVHVTTRGIPGLTPPAHSTAAQKAAHTSSNPNDGNMSSNFFAAAPAGANSAKAKLLQRRSTLFGWTPLPTSKRPTSNPTVPAPKKPPNLPRVPVLPAAQPKSSTAPPAVSQQPLYQVVYPTSSKASDFDKGSRRSSSDYKAFSDKNQWTKWQRQLLGTAFEHKVERVLDPSFCPDPNDPDDIALFGQQQRFLYSVFCKTLQEGKAADILRGYSNMKSPNFGDAQSIYAELVDHFEAGNVARVSAETLETKLTTMRLNKSWSKSVTAFVNSVSHVIRDHKEATGGIQSDTYYIEKLNATFSEHKDMSQHIQALEHTDDAVARRIGGPLPPKTYESQLHELHQYATILDSRYAKIQAHRQRSSNNSNRKGGKGGGGQGGQSQGGGQGQGGQGGQGKGGGQGGQQSGRSQGRGSNQGGGQGSQGRSSLPGPAYISPDRWANMSREERMAIYRQRDQARGTRSAHATATQATADGTSTIGGPPTTIHVNQAQQPGRPAPPQQSAAASQASQAPGSMIRNMMSNATQRSVSNASRRDEVALDGVLYRRVNITYRVSKHARRNVEGALVDGGANGGLLGTDVRILEHVEHTSVDITGVGDASLSGSSLLKVLLWPRPPMMDLSSSLCPSMLTLELARPSIPRAKWNTLESMWLTLQELLAASNV